MISALSLDLAALRQAYANGQITPTSLVEEILRRIDAQWPVRGLQDCCERLVNDLLFCDPQQFVERGDIGTGRIHEAGRWLTR